MSSASGSAIPSPPTSPTTRWCASLLTARGSSYDDPAANYFRVTRDAKPTMEKTTQVFLGVRMVCAQCHDHPFERWTQNQYYQMAAFFSAVGLRAGYEVGEEIVFDQRDDYEMKHPKDGRVVQAGIPGRVRRRAADSRPTSTAAKRWPSGSPRRTIRSSPRPSPTASGATSSATASSIRWTTSAPPIRPSNPALLDALTKDLIDHDFDLRHLMRTIVEFARLSDAHSRPTSGTPTDRDNFSHAYPAPADAPRS